VTVKEGKVRVSVCGAVVLEKEVMYPIEAPNEPEDLDWCLADHSSGYICSLRPHALVA
jgi:hypothetical protein